MTTKTYRVIASNRRLDKGDIVRRIESKYDDWFAKRYETINGSNWGYLMDSDVEPVEEWTPQVGDKVRVNNLNEYNDLLRFGILDEMKDLLGVELEVERVYRDGEIHADGYAWNKEWLEPVVEEPTIKERFEELKHEGKPPICPPNRLEVIYGETGTKVYVDGVEQSNVKSVKVDDIDGFFDTSFIIEYSQ